MTQNKCDTIPNRITMRRIYRASHAIRRRQMQSDRILHRISLGRVPQGVVRRRARGE